MTLFDLIAGLVLAASALVGLARGGAREITTVVAFVVAVLIAVVGLRFVSSIMQQAIHIVWMANTAGVLLLFLFAYIVLRLIGGAISRRVQQTAGLSGLDRTLGLAIGLVRGLVVIGGVALLLDAATPPERRPAWLTSAKLYPVAQTVGAGLRALAPKSLAPVRGVVGDGTSLLDPTSKRGYSRSERNSMDAMVENSR